MEHEDNAHLDNFLQNSQHLMENLQMDRGDGVCDNVAVDEIGGKFEVHEEHDDEEEWKYIKEGQQSEKQQQQQQLKAGVACKDVEGVEEVGNGHGYGYEHGDVGADDILLLDHHEVGNGVVGISAAVNADADNAATGIVENEEVDVEIIKNDGDFSTTSNTTSTAGEDGYADTGVLQVQMQIQNIPQEEFLPKQVADLLEDCPNIGSHADETEEDDPSSLATNNTNRTNSLSESAPNQELQQLSTEEIIIKNEEFSNEDKENTVPSISNVHGDIAFEENTGNSDFDSDVHSQLNPNAIEFVPSFGSNPTSPTTGNSDNQIFVDEEVASNSADEIQLRAQPNSLPRHLLGDDDFVAQSPRKGSAESNLDAIALPEENDFEHEAAKRPHELEQEDDLIGVGTVEHTQQKSQLTNEHLQSLNNYAANMLEIERDANEDYSDRLNQSPLNLIDHGPETSVDLEMDLQPLAVEKDDETQEIPKENLEIIEDVFNTVQPLPIDLNTSFVEETSQQEFTAEGKELLDVEEKENISHSPSTEEMQMNLQNEFHSSVKDIPQIPIDMDNAANMQESFYLESTSSEARQQLQGPFASGIEFSAVDESNFHTNEINAEEEKPVINDPSFDIVQVSAPGTFETEPETALDTSPTSLNIYAPEFTPTPKSIDADIISPSPVSTEEKHLIEETKEQAILSETEELEQKMDDLIISSNDGILSQVEEVAQTAANIVESLNPFAASEPEHHETVEETPIEANQVFSTESQPDADFSQQNEQSYYNEQQEQQHLQEETAESTYEHHEDNLLLTKPEDEQPPAASPVQLELELNGFEEHVPAALSVESNIAAPVEPESVELPVEPAHEYSHVDLLESPVAQPEHGDIRSELVASPIAEPEHEVPVESPVAEPEPEHVTVSEPELKDVPQTEVQPVTEPELIAQPEPEVEVLLSEPVIVLDESSNFDANVSAVTEPILESPDQHSSSIPTEANVELAANESSASAVEETVITAAAVGALAATAAAVAVAADAHKKTDVKQARTPTSTKSKAIDVKKAAEPAKKPIGKTSLSSVSAARPRTAPVKTTATADKKPTTTTTTTKSSTTTAARKPLTSTTAASRTVTKTTTTTRPTTAPTAAKLTASRTTTTTTARRSAPTTTGASATATNGTATAKPKPTSGAPTKPTTLGLSGTTKPKLSSPRTTLTSQLRKAPTSTGTGVAAAKSPLKTTAPTANGVTKSSTTTTTAASRAKSSTSTTTTTTTTKTFTARPAPKTTHSSTLTSTTTRRTVGSVSVSATAAKTTSSTLLKKTPPGATRPATTGKSSLSPTKTASSALKAKTKDVTKKAVTPTKSAKDLKDKHTEEQTKTNGTAVVGAEEPAAIQSEQKPHLNGNGDGDALQLIENGIHKLELENGENPLLEQHIQASLIDA